MSENDSNDVDEVSLVSDPSVFPNLGKQRPADRYKAKLLNKIDIKFNLKIIQTRASNLIEVQNSEIPENLLRIGGLDLNNLPPVNSDNSSSQINLLPNENINIRDAQNVLDRNDYDLINALGRNNILFQKIPIDVRKDIIDRYSDNCEEFANVQIASVKRGDFRKEIT
jgi:hypothetical protein